MAHQHMIKKIPGCQRCRAGYTLIEVLVTVAIFAVLAAAINTVLLVGESSWQVNSVRVELQQDLRKAMDWMKDELRQTAPMAITAGPTAPNGTTYSSITFYLPMGVSGNTINWSANTTQFVLSGTDLLRVEGGVTKVIARNLQTLGFRRQAASSDIIEIMLTAQKDTIKGTPITATLDFEIQMRN